MGALGGVRASSNEFWRDTIQSKAFCLCLPPNSCPSYMQNALTLTLTAPKVSPHSRLNPKVWSPKSHLHITSIRYGWDWRFSSSQGKIPLRLWTWETRQVTCFQNTVGRQETDISIPKGGSRKKKRVMVLSKPETWQSKFHEILSLKNTPLVQCSAFPTRWGQWPSL